MQELIGITSCFKNGGVPGRQCLILDNVQAEPEVLAKSCSCQVTRCIYQPGLGVEWQICSLIWRTAVQMRWHPMQRTMLLGTTKQSLSKILLIDGLPAKDASGIGMQMMSSESN